MGSGYFPLGKSDGEWWDQLTQAADLITSVCDDMLDAVYGNDQTDNAASDGGSMALLRLAAQLVRAEVRDA